MIILNLYGMSFDRVPDIYGQTILKGNRLLLYVMGKEIHHFSEPGQLVYESNYSEAGSIYHCSFGKCWVLASSTCINHTVIRFCFEYLCCGIVLVSVYISWIPLTFPGIGALFLFEGDLQSSCSSCQVFQKRLPPEAVDLICRFFQYSPNLRCTAVSWLLFFAA